MGFRASPYKQTGAVTITGSQTVAGPVTIADDDDASTVDALYLKSEISEPDAPADGEGGVLYVKSDGAVYWKSYEYGETDLTFAGIIAVDGATNILSVTGQVSASLGVSGAAFVADYGTYSQPAFRWAHAATGFYVDGNAAINTTHENSRKWRFTSTRMEALDSTGGMWIAHATGDEGDPTYAFNGDSDTGMFRAGADELGFTAGGAERMRIGTSMVRISSSAARLEVTGSDNSTLFGVHSPSSALTVSGSSLVRFSGSSHYLDIQNTNAAKAQIYASNQITLGLIGGADYLSLGGNYITFSKDLYTSSKNIGIGRTPDNYELEVDGVVQISGSASRLEVTGSDNSTIFGVHSTTNSNILTVTGSGRVGINEADPQAALHVSGGLHLKIADSGLAAPNGDFDDLVIEGSGVTGMTFSTTVNSGIRFQKDGNTDHHGITFDSGTTSIRTRLGSTDRFYIDDAGRTKFMYAGVQYHAGTGNDDAATEPLYLTASGANLIIDCRKGNYGDVTLTANVTAVNFLFHPVDGSVFTMTAKITQHGSSAKTIDYADSAVTVYIGDGTGAASTGEMKWSGGVPHTMSTASGSIDIVQFTIFPNGTTFDVFAAVIGQDFS